MEFLSDHGRPRISAEVIGFGVAGGEEPLQVTADNQVANRADHLHQLPWTGAERRRDEKARRTE